jgi:mannose-6-phosphate isomerase-like protein (cupin superfamily)
MYRNYTTATSRRATTGPVDLFVDAVQFDGSSLHVRPARIAKADGDGDGDWMLATFHVETDADVHADQWEVHPESDEVVWCVRGALRVHFRAPEPSASAEAEAEAEGDDATVRLRTGEAAIVPRATWHRLSLDEPSDVTSILRRRGTRLEPVAPEIRRETS